MPRSTQRSAFSPLDRVEEHRLPNGLRIYLKEDHQSPLVSAHAWIRIGSVDEQASQAGISHILEHMVFKGTTHHKAEEISRWVEALGGGLNAETAKEYTHYYIDVPSAGAKKAVHLLAELLTRATFDPEEWERECPVILEEIKRRNDDPETHLWDLLNEALFEDLQRRRPVIGYPNTVQSVTVDGLKRYYGSHYNALESALVVVGDFNRRQMLSWLQREFRGMPKGERRLVRPRSEVRATNREIRIQKAVKQTYLAMGFLTPDSGHPDHEALDLLASILGDGRGARLVHHVREQQKLVWSISAANLTQEGPGIFAVFAECDAKKRASAVRAIREQWMRLRRMPPTASEITRAKNILQTAWLQGFETYHNQASTLGHFALEHQLDRLKDYLPRILALTRSDLTRVIHRYASLPLASAIIEAA